MLFHLALADDWRAARAAGEYAISTRGAVLEDVGFVHCSTAEQWPGVRARFYADVPDDALVLLSIDEARVPAEVRWEPPVPDRPGAGSAASGPNKPGPELFPHVYGPIPVAAVVAAEPLPKVGR
ncbi:DUF952 domain-containing protein [Tsukamurella sp. 8F]|uniref:DUF952 domain-containing protein n=1 Tax=unclassified Tsukamurella TaxID=2633480 RepID=UPI0023B9DD3B|nr:MULTISPECIES: DUF952 domain-containing protein [unclassified Tsukamurella]MDF0531578.1 DUF952 domain-containing protein [Tsukamurella sp. 8J]MDF0587575.1 DUF952 domain-containing protein [Tsukamurella sp. 8F]